MGFLLKIASFLNVDIVKTVVGLFKKSPEQLNAEVETKKIDADLEKQERSAQVEVGKDIRSSEIKKQELENEDVKNAREITKSSKVDIFNLIVDGICRLIRPCLTFWALAVLANKIPPPPLLTDQGFYIISGIIVYWTGRRTIQEFKK